jgi:plastocyanin domain-containing protein
MLPAHASPGAPRPLLFSRAAVVAVLASVGLGCLACLAACEKKPDAGSESSASLPPAAPGEIRVVANEHGFSPASLSIAKGTPGSMATLSFVRTTEQTCATEVVFPELDIKKTLPLNEAVAVNVPSDADRTLTFQCGMGMYKGALLVK